MTTSSNGTFATAGTLTITSGGTSQEVFPATSTGRAYLFILNTSDTIMYLGFGAAATNTGIPLAANGGWYEPALPPRQSINILCATTGKTFVAVQA